MYNELHLPTTKRHLSSGPLARVVLAPVRFKLAGLKRVVAQMIGGVFSLQPRESVMGKSVFGSIWEAKAEHKRRQAARRKARKTERDKRIATVSHLPLAEALKRVPKKACAHCGVIPDDPHKMHLHHPNGYGPGSEHEVIPLCASCHRKEHGRMKRRGR